MTRPGVLLPVVQNWSCHNCGGCCREHQIVITEEEKRRLEKQNWSSTDGTPSDRPLIVAHGSAWRLNHQPDGACVFLDDRGLCRIHAKYGESSKPLACRTYPYAVHPAGTSVTVSLRFSCPSVVQNIGRPVAQQRSDLEQLAAEIVPGNYRAGTPPKLFADKSLSDWTQVNLIVAWLQRSVSDQSVSLTTRVLRTLAWLGLLENAATESLAPPHLGTLLKLLHETAARAIPQLPEPPVRPSRLARLMFRQFVAQLLRHDTNVTARGGFIGRMKLLSDGLRFSMGFGRVPTQTDPISVAVAFADKSGTPSTTRPRFRDLESPLPSDRADIDSLLARYLNVKLEGLHFCGAAFYDESLIDGFRSLALMIAAVHWLARLRAHQRGSESLSLTDAQAALATLDHNFGYSPVLGMRASRSRIRQLTKLGQIELLCNWYCR